MKTQKKAKNALLYVKRHDVWMVRSYQDVFELSRDPRCSSARITNRGKMIQTHSPEKYEPLLDFFRSWVIFRDGAEHTRLRKLVNQGFAPRILESLKPAVHEITDKLLITARENGGLDGVADFAVPLPLMVIGRLLGIRDMDREELFRWSIDLADFFGTASISEELADRADRTRLEISDYIRSNLNEIRSHPGNDFLTHLLEARIEGEQLDEEQLVANLAGLLFAGNETTRHLLGNAVYYLVTHPELVQQLQREPELWPTAIEEILRLDPPIRFFNREATEDFHWKGASVKKGARLLMNLSQANMDPEIFSEPDQFRLDREKNKHLSFGTGAHFCLGAGLARMEAKIALITLFDNFTNLSLDGEALKTENQSFNGYKTLPLRIN